MVNIHLRSVVGVSEMKCALCRFLIYFSVSVLPFDFVPPQLIRSHFRGLGSNPKHMVFVVY